MVMGRSVTWFVFPNLHPYSSCNSSSRAGGRLFHGIMYNDNSIHHKERIERKERVSTRWRRRVVFG